MLSRSYSDWTTKNKTILDYFSKKKILTTLSGDETLENNFIILNEKSAYLI